MTGTDFTGDASSVSLELDGVAQTTESVSATEAVFVISDVSDTTVSYGELYFAEGIPNGHSVVETGVQLEPSLVSVSPNSGSLGGTLIIANVQGVGVNTQDLQLVDQFGADICESV